MIACAKSFRLQNDYCVLSSKLKHGVSYTSTLCLLSFHLNAVNETSRYEEDICKDDAHHRYHAVRYIPEAGFSPEEEERAISKVSQSGDHYHIVRQNAAGAKITKGSVAAKGEVSEKERESDLKESQE